MYRKNTLSHNEILKLLNDEEVASIQLNSFLKKFDILKSHNGFKINDNGTFHKIDYNQLVMFLTDLDLDNYDVIITHYL